MRNGLCNKQNEMLDKHDIGLTFLVNHFNNLLEVLNFNTSTSSDNIICIYLLYLYFNISFIFLS